MPFLPLLADLTWLSPLGFATGIGLLTWFLLRRTFTRLGKRRRAGSGAYLLKQQRPNTDWDGAKQDANARFDRQSVELHELARELNGQIESKMILLQTLIAQSKQQADRLEVLLKESEKVAAADD